MGVDPGRSGLGRHLEPDRDGPWRVPVGRDGRPRSPLPSGFWIVVFGFVIELTIPALYVYMSELYPTHLRAIGFGWASMVSRIGAGFVPLIFGSLLWPHRRQGRVSSTPSVRRWTSPPGHTTHALDCDAHLVSDG